MINKIKRNFDLVINSKVYKPLKHKRNIYNKNL